jgi:hypothetical protein
LATDGVSLKLERHLYKKDRIVIGGCLQSLIYAFKNNLPVIFTNSRPPFRYDKIEKDYDLSFLGLDPSKTYYQRQVWERLLFLLGLAGNMPLSDNASGLRVVDNLLTATTNNHRVVKFEFNKLIVFDDESIFGLPAISAEIREKNRVIDWVNVRSGAKHQHDEIDGKSDFINHIIFYPSDRCDNKNLKDLVAISYLTDEQLLDHEYSDTMAKFKILKMMKSIGIRGMRNGRDVKYPDKYKYYAVRIEPSERIVEPDTKRYYEPDERFEFRYDTVFDLLVEPKKPKNYLGMLCDIL